MAITREELVGGITPASFRFQRERREETVEVMMLTGGVHSSAREERSRGTGSGFARWAAGCFWGWAEWFPPGPFSIFISFFLLFSFLISISFVSFAKRLQFNSNHFQKFSKIQNNHTEQ
jgi:hypothetical protein